MPDTPPEERLSTVFHNRWVKLCLLVVVLCFVLYLLGALAYRLRSVLIPFCLALIGAYILNPLVGLLHARLRWSRVLIVVLVLSVLTLIVVAGLAFGVYYTVRTVEDVAARTQAALHGTGEAEGLIAQTRQTIKRVPAALRDEIQTIIKGLPGHLREHLGTISSSLFLVVTTIAGTILTFAITSFNFVLFFVVAGYLLIDWPDLERKSKALLPRWHKQDVLRIAGEIDRDLRAFFRGQFLVALALAAIYSVGLFISGIPFALVIAVVAGLANMVPYLGIAVGLAPALALSLIPYDGLFAPIAVLATFIVGQTLDGVLLTPKIVGDSVGLNPVIIILAIFIFGELFGFLGVIFAVPMASALKVLLAELLRYYDQFRELEKVE